MIFRNDSPTLIEDLSSFFHRSAETVLAISVFADSIDVGNCYSFDTDTCNVEVFLRDLQGNAILDPETKQPKTATLVANKLTIVGARGWTVEFTRTA